MDVRSWNIAGIAVLTVVTIGYLAFTNENATGGYELRTVERRADVLREEVRQLELSAIDVQSDDRISKRINVHEYVPVAQVQYLTPDHAVAQK